MNNYVKIFKIGLCVSLMSLMMPSHAFAATNLNKFNSLSGKFISAKSGKFLKLAAVDLPQILPYIMKSGDVFQGYEVVNYKGKRALKLRIFNQKTGRVRYVYVDEQSGKVL